MDGASKEIYGMHSFWLIRLLVMLAGVRVCVTDHASVAFGRVVELQGFHYCALPSALAIAAKIARSAANLSPSMHCVAGLSICPFLQRGALPTSVGFGIRRESFVTALPASFTL